MAGWQWIFFFEGLLTIVLAIAAYWLLVGFPDSKQPSWKFLNERELAWVVRRVNADRGDSKTPKFEWKKFFSAGLDIKIWYVSRSLHQEGWGLIANIATLQGLCFVVHGQHYDDLCLGVLPSPYSCAKFGV